MSTDSLDLSSEVSTVNVTHTERWWKALEPGCEELVFICAPGGNYFVGILAILCMEFTCKLASSLVVDT
eukprot:1145081-Pelagomonas_calceolata.AAC.1